MNWPEAASTSHADDDEGEFAGLPQQQPGLQRGMAGQTEGAAQRGDDRGLEQDQPGDRREQPHRHLRHQAPIDAHAHRHEEQPQHQPLEGFEIDLDLVAELGLGQQQPGQKGAQRHRQPGRRGQHRGPQHHQQDGGHEHLAAARLGHDMQRRAQHETPSRVDPGDRQRGLGQRRCEFAGDTGRGLRRQHADQEEDRHHREILGQEYREAGAAERRGEAACLDQDLDGDRGRGQGQGRAEDRGRRHAVAESERDRRDGRAGHADLERAEAEHEPAHRPEPVERHLEPDREQQEHDAELGEVAHALEVGDHDPGERGNIGRQQPEPERPDRTTDREIAKHRVDA
jgi:hypothetical protein